MYNRYTDALFFNLIKLKQDTKSLKEALVILRSLLDKHGLPRNPKTVLKPSKYTGDSFILHPRVFIMHNCPDEFKWEALEIASLRNYSDYTLYNRLDVNAAVIDTNKLVLKLNPLLEVKNDIIHIKTGNIWH